ncbi:hypothetical protein BDQ17DRAFT_1364990, partial [Cyathus striatus]
MVSYHQLHSSSQTYTTAKPHPHVSKRRRIAYYSDSDIVMADDSAASPPKTPERAQTDAPVAGRPLLVSNQTRTKSTPRGTDFGSESDHHSGHSVGANDYEVNKPIFDRWLKFHKAFDTTDQTPARKIAQFLEQFVPSSAAELPVVGGLNSTLLDHAKAIPTTGLEKDTYGPIRVLLDACQMGFPTEKKISFQNTHNVKPLSGPTNRDHDTLPDLSGPYPGAPTPPLGSGQNEKDPVALKSSYVQDSKYQVGAIAQLVKDARNLLYASSSCYVYVIGIYTKSQRMRIHRFDHSGSVSCGFSYVRQPSVIRDFLWRLVHPLHNIPNTVVGWDESIHGIPGSPDDDIPSVVDSDSPTNDDGTSNQHPSGGDAYGFTFGTPLYKSSGLVSRATHVTRIMVKILGNFYVLVLKDSWHQRARELENDFYERIQERYIELESKSEFGWVKEIYANAIHDPGAILGVADYYGQLDLSTIQSTSGSASDRGHTTASQQVLEAEKNRSRALTGPVGIGIRQYKSTKELVTVLRDAVVGHFIARSCGVLHRDISIGNILMVDVDGRVQGFIHDFDYASFVDCHFGLQKHGDVIDTDLKDFKTLTGTPQFMAVHVLDGKMHEARHDLESFYWVLVWILLRHSEHNHEDGINACTNYFDISNFKFARNQKSYWLTQMDEPFNVKDNAPLNDLLTRLRNIFRQGIANRDFTPTHEEVVRVLNDALKVEGWPTDDKPLDRSAQENDDRIEGEFQYDDEDQDIPDAPVPANELPLAGLDANESEAALPQGDRGAESIAS